MDVAVEAEDEVLEAEDVDVLDVVEVDELLAGADVVVEENRGNLASMKFHGGSVDSGWVHVPPSLGANTLPPPAD